MATKYALDANARDGAGKGIARALRRNGQTPAVIYGDKKEPVLISLDSNTVNVEYNRGGMFTTLCDLTVGNDKHLVLARDVQLHPVTDVVEHVDFLRVTSKTKISVAIPIAIVGEDESTGIRAGGILNAVRFEIELNCSATAIPDEIEVSVAGTEIGDSVKISNVNLPEGTSPVIDDRDFTIVTIDAPKTVEEEAADQEAADEAAEAVGEEGEEVAGGEDAPAAEESSDE